MTKPKNRRWSCPEGEHPGVLAPGRLRKIDIRRYCLPCSQKAGVLVERVCAANHRRAALSRQRSAKKQASKRRSAAATRRNRKEAQLAREVVSGVDVAREYNRVWAHAVKLHPTMLHPTAPSLTVSVSETWTDTSSGHANPGFSTHLTLGSKCPPTRLCGLIAHEITHHIYDQSGTEGRKPWHGEVFWSLLAELVEAAYPGTQVGVLSGDQRVKQSAIQKAMKKGCEWLTTKPFTAPRKPPVSGQRRTKVHAARGGSR